MVIYADILFLLNALVTYVCLVGTALLLHTPLKRVRFLCASLIGGAYSLSILSEIPTLISVLLKIAVCIVLIVTAFGKMKVKSFLFHILFFLVLNVALAGAVLLLSHFNQRDFYSDMVVVYINLSPTLLLLSLALCYAVVVLITKVVMRHRQNHTVFKVDVYFGGERFRLFGFCDSGNHLTEPFSSLPVCILKENCVKGFAAAPYPRVIPFSSLAGEGLLQATKARIDIFDGNKRLFSGMVYLAESGEAFKDMAYDIILNPKVFEETEKTNETDTSAACR